MFRVVVLVVKLIREAVGTMVMFDNNIVNPILVTSKEGNFKINHIIRSYPERRNLRDCKIFICQAEGRPDPIELRWDLESNKWYLERM